MIYSIAVASSAPEGYPVIFKGALYGSIKKAYDLGYGGIEWHIRKPDFHEAEDVKKYCDELLMPVTSIGTGMGCVIDGLTLMHADKNIRVQAVRRLKEFIHMGAELNSVVIIGSMKGKIPAGEESSKFKALCVENLKEVMDHAEKKNVKVVMEVLNRYETNFLNTVEQMTEFISGIGSKLLKAHVDTFHMNIEEANISESIGKYAGTIGHVHFADSNRRHPGAGHIDFKAVLKALESIGYDRCVAIECLPYPDPDTAAENTIKFLSKIKV